MERNGKNRHLKGKSKSGKIFHVYITDRVNNYV